VVLVVTGMYDIHETYDGDDDVGRGHSESSTGVH